MKTKYVYSDAKIGLEVDHNGVVDVVYDEDCIRQSIMTIFSTVSLERVRNPIGSRLIELLFQPINDEVARTIRRELRSVIERWEPRVTITKLIIRPEYEDRAYSVEATYTINKLGKEYNLRTGLRSFS